MEIFKILKLRVKDHDVFKENIEFDLFQESDSENTDSPYFTMILGPNGTGKSNLLRLIIEIFKIGYEKSKESEIKKYISGKYYLEYHLNGNNYIILNTLGWFNGDSKPDDTRDEKGIRVFKDGNEISFTLDILPKSILAVSIMLNDKFPVFKNENDFDIYSYLGVKRDANTAGTRSYITKTVEMIFKAAHKKSFVEDTAELLKFLDLDTNLFISYSPRYKHIFFDGKLSVDKLDDFYSNYSKYLKRETEPWSVKVYNNFKEKEPDVLPKLVELINFISSKLQTINGSRSKFYEFDVFDSSTDVTGHFKYLPYLQRLDLISFPEIVLQKNGRYFSVENSSSGEYHLISTIISVLACISENSLILIDEPEISLHPNWQMKYIEFLNQIFKNYSSSHFIICSHSHFLVSDLKPQNSTILSLTKEKVNDGSTILPFSKYIITSKQLPYDTFGWSAEDVLYNIFNVRSSLNYYLEADLTHLLGMISNNIQNRQEISRILKKLELLPIRENDPLQEIIIEANQYLNTIP